jgi:biotin transport system substrate-specific component
MAKVISTRIDPGLVDGTHFHWLNQAGVVISATAFLAACAHVSFPLLFSPVPVSLQNFGVLLLGLVFGPNRAAAALTLYLFEGACGLPVFSPTGPGGLAQLFGPTGGFLLAYPVVAYMCGYISQKMGPTMRSMVIACLSAEFLLFVSGAAYLRALTGGTLGQTLQLAVVPFLPGEVLKMAAASWLAMRWFRLKSK